MLGDPARIAVLAAAVALAAATVPPPSGGGAPHDASPAPACFSPRDIANFRTPDLSVVTLRIGRAGEVFKLEFSSACPNIDWTYGFTIRGGAREVCEGQDQEVEIVPSRTSDSGLATRCRIIGVQRLSPAEIAALPRGDRP